MAMARPAHCQAIKPSSATMASMGTDSGSASMPPSVASMGTRAV
jgi:hypothetical protein